MKFPSTLLAIAFLTVSVYSQSSAPAGEFTAAEVLDRAADAVISNENAEKLGSIIFTYKVTMSTGQSGSSKLLWKKGGKILAVSKLGSPGVSVEVRQGCNGERCFADNSSTGVRELEGQEMELLQQSVPHSARAWRGYVEKAVYKGIERVIGRDAHHVALISKHGAKEDRYIDAENFLLLRSRLEFLLAMRKVTLDAEYWDFTVSGGYRYFKR